MHRIRDKISFPNANGLSAITMLFNRNQEKNIVKNNNILVKNST